MYGHEITLAENSGNAKHDDVDISLVARFQAGDTTAFEDIFTLYKDTVFRLAFRLLGDREEALDLSQDVFLTLYKELRRFRRSSRFKTWIYRIVVNRALNRLRLWKRQRRHQTISLDALPKYHKGESIGASLPAADRSPYETLYGQDVARRIHQALALLPMDQRAAIIMRDMEGFSYEEIAEALEINLGTVKSRIARGREELRRHLHDVLRTACPL
ncbi:MAG: sigma-70 family RNA polymerase sigma factor [Acidobacteria bacterium]|nr:sigma-70 family RNA polymerase sigma factor [Acidobacteriota bacterium]